MNIPAETVVGVGCRIEIQGRRISATRNRIGWVLARTIVDRGRLVVVGCPLVRASLNFLLQLGVFAGTIVGHRGLIEIEGIWIGAS